MSRYKRIRYTTHPTAKVVDVVLVEPDGSKYPNSPVSWTTFGSERATGVKLDEEDVRAIHAKLGEVIQEWDA